MEEGNRDILWQKWPESAFRILRLSKSSWKWLVMKAQDPLTGEWKYFIDKCLPFGSSISCSHFQRFSNALQHLIEWGAQAQGRVMNYLDDFLFIALSLLGCNYLINEFLKLCEDLNVPVLMEKTEWASEFTIFLGILLDRWSMTLGVPLDKRERAIKLLQTMIDKKKAKVRELQSLCGYLNFICKAIFPGRTFLRRMYAKYSGVIDFKAAWGEKSEILARINADQPSCTQGRKLKQHHHVR